MKRTVLLLACLVLVRSAGAVQVSGLFTDGMVLQQGQPVPVWGWGEPGEPITVEFAGQKQFIKTDPEGKWRVTLDPLKSSTEERTLVVKGEKTVSFKEVLVGEVWLCSGQSNMAMALSEADGGKEEMERPDPLLRAFRVPERPAERSFSNVIGSWSKFTLPESRNWSATPYFFGKKLRDTLGVPVGLVVCAWGGSSTAAWMSPRALSELGPLLPEDVITWRSNIQLSRLYHGMLNPLVPCALAGVIWYQGETEAMSSQNPFLYRQLFPALIRDWRAQWNRAELPFYFVQLPMLAKHDDWPIVRESQAAALALPATGMISTIDLSQDKNLHPTNKKQFGDRLANLVLAKTYARNTWPGAPVFEKMDIQPDGSIRLQFRDAAGLKTEDGGAPVGFQIAAEGGDFQNAEARIEGETVMVSSKEVKQSTAVRYAWAGSMKANLVNGAGLPLAPFRTDSRLVRGQEWRWESLPGKATLQNSATGIQLSQEKAPGWKLEWVERAKQPKAKRLREHGKTCQIAVTDSRRGASIRWAMDPEISKGFDVSKGLTIEAKLQMYVATDPFHGFEIEAGLPQPDGSFRRYLFSIRPMRSYAFQEEGEIRLLRSNMDNTIQPHTYRMAIRPDGVAQIYFDGEPLGLCTGETLSEKQQPYLRVGKQTENGELTATLHEVSFEPAGAFAPQ